MLWVIQYIEDKGDYRGWTGDPYFEKNDIWGPPSNRNEAVRPRDLNDVDAKSFSLVFEGTRLEAIQKARKTHKDNDGSIPKVKMLVIDCETGDTVYNSDEDIARILGQIEEGDKIGWWWTPYGSRIPEKRCGILHSVSEVSGSQPHKRLWVTESPRHKRKLIGVDPYMIFERTRKGESSMSLELV